MKLFIGLAVCLLLLSAVRAEEEDLKEATEMQTPAEDPAAEQDVNTLFTALSSADTRQEKDFLLGLIHHAVHGVLNVGHHALHLVGHILGDNELSLEDVDAVLARLSKTDNQEEKDFLFGLIHHAVRGVLGAAHGVLHLAGHILGDEQVKDFNIVLAAAVKADSQEKKDFLFGLIHHAVHGTLGVAHGILHLAGHILGDEHLSPKDIGFSIRGFTEDGEYYGDETPTSKTDDWIRKEEEPSEDFYLRRFHNRQ